MKIGAVNHHLLTSAGNSFYENFGLTVQGWPYVNIEESDNEKWLRVKFYAPTSTKVRYYIWNFGDGTTLKTINREVEHRYSLTNKSEWLTNSGPIPILEFGPAYGIYYGNWTGVTLTAISYDNRISNSSTQYVACIYEITNKNPGSTIDFGEGSLDMPEGSIEL